MITCRNADVEAVAVKAVEGKPMYGGDMLVKPLIKGDEMTFLEIHYAAVDGGCVRGLREPGPDPLGDLAQ